MEVRPATSRDRSSIREVARDSFESSYALSPQEIEAILEDAFTPDALADRIDDSNVHLLVAEGELDDVSGVQGFIDVIVEDDTTVQWLHVHPNARGRGVAAELVERVMEDVENDGGSLRARVLADAAEGGEFFEGVGLERSGSDVSEFGGEEYTVVRFTEGGGSEEANEPSVPVPEMVDSGGSDRFLDREDAISGTDAPFFHLYSDREQEEPYGYFCSQCASTDVSADGLDRLVCNSCGNQHDANKWDKAFL